MKNSSLKPLKRLANAFGTNHFLGVFVMVILLVFVVPSLQRLLGVGWLLDLTLLGVLLLTILSLSNPRTVYRIVVVFALIGFSGRITERLGGSAAYSAWANGALVLFFLLSAIVIFRYVLRARRVTSNTIWAALCVYVFMGLLWAFVYAILAYVNPAAFSSASELFVARGGLGVSTFNYFSFVTLTTLGYGDITPVSEAARSLSSLEAITGQVYLTVLVARLVGMHIATANEERRLSDPSPEDQA